MQAIADIAAQPEAPQEPGDLVLAAFAHTQHLTDQLNESMRARGPEFAATTALCDDCYAQRTPVKVHDDAVDNLYCEIDVVK